MKRLLILLLVISAGCRINGQANKLPDLRPADFALSYHLDGGMRYYSEDLTIGADSCMYMINDGGKKVIKKFILTSKELDDLYAMLKQNQFNRIEYIQQSGVYDRGGVWVKIGWNKELQHYTVNDSQMSFVSKNWMKEWQAVCSYLELKLMRR